MTKDQGSHPPDGNQGSHPLIRVTRGQPTPEDIAALSAVVTAILARRSRAAAETEARRPSPTRPGWPDRAAYSARR